MFKTLEKESPAVFGASTLSIEDSGYHTSFTPSFVEHSVSVSDSYEAISCLREKNQESTPLSLASTPKKKRNFKNVSFILESPYEKQASSSKKENTPQKERKARKRSWLESAEPTPTIFTPNGIVTDLQRLRVADDSPAPSIAFDKADYFHFSIGDTSKTYPVTPKKVRFQRERKCRKLFGAVETVHTSNLTKSEDCLRKSAKKLFFNSDAKLCRVLIADNRCDIITRIRNRGMKHIIEKILLELPEKDLSNFSLVSKSWQQISQTDRKASHRLKHYYDMVCKRKENYSNREQTIIPSSGTVKLRNIMNVVHSHSVRQSTIQRSPPTTPKTRKFKKYIEVASLDSRVQLTSCIRCDQPATISRNESGEEWAKCSSKRCGHTYCRFCHCEQHQKQPCQGYDHEAVSPSKRLKRSTTVIGDKQSKRFLRRL